MNSLTEAEDFVQPPQSFLDNQILTLPQRFLDLLPVGVYVCDRDGLIVRYNRAARELWGRAPKLGDPGERFCGAHRLYHPDGTPLPHAECPMANVLHTGNPMREEVVIERPDGSRIMALAAIDALRDSDGNLVGAVNCVQDITERKRAEAALRANEHQSRELLQALPVAVYTTDAAGRILYHNEAAAELWGRSPELGKSEWCGSWRLYRPDGSPLPHDECPMAVALREGRPIKGAEAVAERPDGTRISFLAYPTPLHDESGALVGGVNTLVDISGHKSAGDIRQRLASIVESSDDAIVGKDLNGIVHSWNGGAERLFGYTAKEIIGRPVAILIPPGHENEEPGILARLRQGERIDHYETVRQRKDGSLVEISLTVSPIRNDENKIVGASKVARDITDRKRAEEQRALLLREMNHRVKNLFALAVGIVSLSARSAGTPQEMAAGIRNRLFALSRAHDLTLHELSGQGDNVAGSTTLKALLQTIVSPFTNMERERGARVTLDGPDVSIGGSAIASFALLLHELATNAAKYGALSSPAGHVDVAWSIDGDQLLLSWAERGGPPLTTPIEHEGFGTILVGGTVKGQLGGEITRDWKPEGLTVHLSLRLDRLAA